MLGLLFLFRVCIVGGMEHCLLLRGFVVLCVCCCVLCCVVLVCGGGGEAHSLEELPAQFGVQIARTRA
jgi:hypothetical protein